MGYNIKEQHVVLFKYQYKLNLGYEVSCVIDSYICFNSAIIYELAYKHKNRRLIKAG